MLRAGHVIALCALGLLTVGVVMVNSAGMRVAPAHTGEALKAVSAHSIIFSRSTAYMVIAVAALAFSALLPVRAWADALVGWRGPNSEPASLTPVIVTCALFVVLLGLVYAPVIGREVNGSHRWLVLPIPGLGSDASGGGVSVQPSEIVKWGLIVLMAWYAAARASVLTSFWKGLIPALIALGAVSGAIVIEDLGTGALVALVACLILLAGGARVWHFLLFVPAGIALVVVAIIKSPYRVQRILAFLDPYADAKKSGYHMIQSMVAIHGDGSGMGRGLGFGLQKFGYLPEDQTDFLFAVLCEELGLAGAAIVVALFIAMLWAGLSIVRRETSVFLKLIAFGIVATVGLQALINLVVVTGLGPTKGIALPLVSSGGTGWILTCFCLGILVAIDRAQHQHDTAHSLSHPSDRLADASTT